MMYIGSILILFGLNFIENSYVPMTGLVLIAVGSALIYGRFKL